ncbi:MAG TPA: AzlC family ABC transporter permease [Casimicrobiaceae bacterium]
MRNVLTNRDFRAGFAEMVPANVGLTPFGLVCGVGAAAAGTNLLGALGMSAIIFSGAAQILAIQLLATGAPLAVIVLTCFVAGLRFLMYSAAMAPYLRPLSPRWQRVLAFLLTDQAFAASIRRFDAGGHPREGAMHFLGGGFALWLWWQVTNGVGYFAGNLIPPSWSLDFTVPLCFVGLLVPVLRTSPALIAALTAGVAVIALDALPMRLSLIAAGVMGIVAGTLADTVGSRWKRR